MNNIIPIFFASDNTYAQFLSVALNSAIKNSSPDRHYKAIILHQDISNENIQKILSLSKSNFEIEFIPMKKELGNINDSMGNRLRCDYFTLTIYFRLFIPTMFPEFDKAIYIDSDVVVKEDIAELYDTDIGNNYIGACRDLSVADIPPIVKYMENAVGVDKNKYINSGVLLMNLKKLRQAKLDEHFLNLFSTYKFDCIAPDQDYLNAICSEKIYYLNDNWDTMPNENKPPVEKPKLIHYNLFSKPWCYSGIQYENEFWKYAKDSGFYNEIRKFKDEYSAEQIESDRKCLNLLLERGNSICEQKITFKKMFESGAKIRL